MDLDQPGPAGAGRTVGARTGRAGLIQVHGSGYRAPDDKKAIPGRCTTRNAFSSLSDRSIQGITEVPARRSMPGHPLTSWKTGWGQLPGGGLALPEEE